MILPRLSADGRGWTLAGLIINGLLQAAATIATALLIRAVFDGFITPAGAPAETGILWLGAGLIGAAVAAALLRLRERIDAERLGQDYVYQVRGLMFDQLARLVPRALQQRSRGGILLRFTGDLAAIRQWISLGIARLSVAGVVTVGTLALLALLNLRLALLVGVALVCGAGIAFLLGRPLEAKVREARKRQGYLAGNINEKVASIAVVQVHNQGDRERRRLDRQSRRLRSALLGRARWAGSVRAVSEATARLATSAALLLGAAEVARGAATPGTVVAAMTVVGLLVPPIRDLGRAFEYWKKARVSRSQLEGFFAIPYLVKEKKGAVRLRRGKGRLTFDRVSLSPAVRRISATAEPGSTIAIVGANGAGKSTLLWLAARLLDPDKGRILLDDQPLSGVRLASLRRAIGIVGPGLPLLRGTVASNLRYRDPRASAAEVARVTRLCGVDEVLAELPDGAETRLADEGSNLSVGQRHRIALARGMLGEPRLLLLDEPDANLDPRSLAAFREVLRNYPHTVLMVTHDIDSLLCADEVWCLEQGRLVESGKPRRLLAGNGPTSQLFRYMQVVGQ